MVVGTCRETRRFRQGAFQQTCPIGARMILMMRRKTLIGENGAIGGWLTAGQSRKTNFMSSEQSLTKEPAWKTQDGERIPYSKMRTSHLFYALRMIWNHTTPPEFHIEGGRYDGPENWSVESRKRKVQMLVTELSRRRPLPAWMVEQLKQMQSKGLQLKP